MQPGRRDDLRRFLARHDGTASVIVVDPEGLGEETIICLDGLAERCLDVRSLPAEPLVERASAVVVAAGRAQLRRLASGMPDLGRAPVVAVWLERAATPVVVPAGPTWPPIRQVNARPLDGGFLTVLRFRRPAQVSEVVRAFARHCTPGRPIAESSLVVAATPGERPPGLDPGLLAVADTEAAAAEDRPVPPDVVLADGGVRELRAHPVLGRAPVVVHAPSVPPYDELLVNPIGFRAATGSARGRLVGRELQVDDRVHHLHAGVDEVLVAALRGVRVVEVDWSSRPAPGDVVGLAGAGVPLTGPRPPAETADALGLELAAQLAVEVDLDDALAREMHSIGLRRAAFTAHSLLARRAGWSATTGRPRPTFAPVSIVLATRRPELLGSALAQLAHQRAVDLEIVVAAHGFDLERDEIGAAVAGREVVALSLPAETLFGDVLASAAAAASGEVLVKIDDDDLYGPWFVHDLMMARRYSGAQVLGVPAEFVYLADHDATVQRRARTECFGGFVAGGTMMIDRGLYQAVGGFRHVHRFVDAQLLHAVRAAGAEVYRGHGLGYLLRRGVVAEHTWAQDSDYFLAPATVSRRWPGEFLNPVLRPVEGTGREGPAPTARP